MIKAVLHQDGAEAALEKGNCSNFQKVLLYHHCEKF